MSKIILSLFVFFIIGVPLSAKINLYVLYDFSSQLKGDGSYLTIDSDYEYSFSNREGGRGFSVGAEYEDKIKDSIGYIVGYNYYFPRYTDEVKVSYGGTSTTGTLTESGTYQLSTIYGNLTYNFDNDKQVYAGLNYSLPSYHDNNPAAADINLKSGLGYQVGGVFKFNDQFSVDASYQFINMDASTDAPANLATIDNVNLNGFKIACKYMLGL